MENKTFQEMHDIIEKIGKGATKHSIGLVRYDIIDEATDKVCDHYYELDGKQVSKSTAIDYTLYKKCFHVLAVEDKAKAVRISNNG